MIKEKLYRIKVDKEPWRLFWVPLAGLSFLFRRRLRNNSHRRILFINFGGLGDVLMMTPALRALKERFPGVKLDLMVGKNTPVEEAFRGHPDMNRIIPVTRFRMASFSKSFKPWVAILKIIYLYPTEYVQSFLRNYEVAINFGTMFPEMERFGNAFIYSLGMPTRIGFDGNESWHLTHRVEKSTNLDGRRIYLNFLEPLGIKGAKKELYFPVSKDTRNPIAKQIILGEDKFWIVLHPGGKIHINSRRWPLEHFARVGRFLLSIGGGIIITGDHDDQDICDELAKKLGNGIINACNKLNFKETAFVLSLCKLCLTNDTSIVHLSDAVKVPNIIAIFGPTCPSSLVADNDRYHIIKSDLSCAPCRVTVAYEHVRPCHRETKQECLKTIKPRSIIEKIKIIFPERIPFHHSNDITVKTNRRAF